MREETLCSAIEKLRDQYLTLNWIYHDFSMDGQAEKVLGWPGPPDDSVLIVVHQSDGQQEPFHRHDFFYFNYTYEGEYDSISFKYDHRITIREGELYAGQPFAGHALCVHDNRLTTIIGVLIRRETFFQAFLPMLSADSRLFRFFLDPSTNQFSEEFIHFRIEESDNIRTLLEMIVVEYANKREDTQDVLRPLVLSFLLQVARQYAAKHPMPEPIRLSDRIIQYMSGHFDTVTLKDIAAHFSYHPNYISSLLHRETGHSFSEILLELRMERAAVLLKETDLSVEKIAWMLGYSNSSNFHKAFREYYHQSPRDFTSSQKASVL